MNTIVVWTDLSNRYFNHLSRSVADAAGVLFLCYHCQLKKLKATIFKILWSWICPRKDILR